MTHSTPEDEGKGRREPPRISASAEAAALRRQDAEPADPQAPPATAADQPKPGDRHSASAEAAALRWREQHEDDEQG
jgi:hypothetical protein